MQDFFSSQSIFTEWYKYFYWGKASEYFLHRCKLQTCWHQEPLPRNGWYCGRPHLSLILHKLWLHGDGPVPGYKQSERVIRAKWIWQMDVPARRLRLRWCLLQRPLPLSLYVGHSMSRSAPVLCTLINLSWTFVSHAVNFLTRFLSVLNCKYWSVSAGYGRAFATSLCRGLICFGCVRSLGIPVTYHTDSSWWTWLEKWRCMIVYVLCVWSPQAFRRCQGKEMRSQY